MPINVELTASDLACASRTAEISAVAVGAAAAVAAAAVCVVAVSVVSGVDVACKVAAASAAPVGAR